jgi:hypothetical protein
LQEVKTAQKGGVGTVKDDNFRIEYFQGLAEAGRFYSVVVPIYNHVDFSAPVLEYDLLIFVEVGYFNL